MESAILRKIQLLNIAYWTCIGLYQRSTEELWMLVSHISSQLQGMHARSPVVTIATDDAHYAICWRFYRSV